MSENKYIIFDANHWFDGADEESTLEWAEKAFQRAVSSLESHDEDYVYFAKIIKYWNPETRDIILVEENSNEAV